MAKKSKKRAAKPKTKKKALPVRKAAPLKKTAAKKAVAKKAMAKKAKPAAKARPAKPRGAKRSPEQQLGQLNREERALEADTENEVASSKLPESPEYIPEAMGDSLAEQLGEAAVESATSGDQADENIRDEDVPEDDGGPFVETTAQQEFAEGTDASNPEDAEPADFPTANARRKK